MIVDFAVVWIGAGVRVLPAAEFEQLDAVVGADLVSEVVEEFEHREGLLRRPIGRDFEVDDFAAENVGFFTAPYEVRGMLGKPVIDRANQTVDVKLPNGVTRTAKYLGSQGCVTLPLCATAVNFTPVTLKSQLPDPATQPWPMGDVLPKDPLPPEIDAAKLKAALDAAFQPPEGLTAAFVVTWKGRLIAERYGNGLDMHTPLEGWSMGKSVTATLFGTLLQKGMYELSQPAPIPEWQTPGDPRAESASMTFFTCRAGCGSGRHKTRIMIPPDLIRTTCISTQAGSISYHYAASRPQQWPPPSAKPTGVSPS